MVRSMHPTLQSRRQEERESRVRAFLDAASMELLEKGFLQLSLASVARRARLSKSLIYFYFADKEELIVALANEAKAALLAKFQAARQKHESGGDQLHEIGHAFVGFPRSHPHHWEVLREAECIGVVNREGEVYEETRRLSQEVHAQTVAAIECGRADGSLRKIDESPLEIAVLLWSFLYGFMRLMEARGEAIRDALGVDVDKLVDAAVRHAGAAQEVRDQS